MSATDSGMPLDGRDGDLRTTVAMVICEHMSGFYRPGPAGAERAVGLGRPPVRSFADGAASRSRSGSRIGARRASSDP